MLLGWWKYATASLVPFFGRFCTVYLSAKNMSNVFYGEFTIKIYAISSQDFRYETLIGSGNMCALLCNINLLVTSIDQRMKELSPFMNDDDMYSTLHL